MPIIAGYLLSQVKQLLSPNLVRNFRRGEDYTIAHHNSNSKVRQLQSTLCFVKCDTKSEHHAWTSGNFGGFECFIPTLPEVEDSASTAEVYDTTSSEEHLISVQASFNTLSLVQNDGCDFFSLNICQSLPQVIAMMFTFVIIYKISTTCTCM